MRWFMWLVLSVFILVLGTACASADDGQLEALESDPPNAAPQGDAGVSGGGNNGPNFGRGGIPSPEEVCYDCPLPESDLDTRVRPPYRQPEGHVR